MQNPVGRTRSLSLSATSSLISLHRARRFRQLGTVTASSLLFSFAASSINKNKPSRVAAKSGTSSSDDLSKFGGRGRRITDLLLLLNVAAFGVQVLTGNLLLHYGAKINELISKGELWRFVTSAFLHGDLLHLVLNCTALHQIGPMLELPSGRSRFLTTYLGSAISGGVLSYIMSPHTSIGASGAIFGIASAFAVYLWRHKTLLGPGADDMLIRLRDAAVLNFAYGLVIRHVDNWGHLGGLIGGAALSYLLGPRIVRSRENKRTFVDKPLLPIFGSKPRKPRRR